MTVSKTWNQPLFSNKSATPRLTSKQDSLMQALTWSCSLLNSFPLKSGESSQTLLYNDCHEVKTRQDIQEDTHTLNQRLDHFLKTEQNKAYAIVMLNLKNQADAMDVLQNAMLAFVSNYKNKPQDQWKPLFYRILQNKIKDHFRKQSSWLRLFLPKSSDHEGEDWLANHASDQPSPSQQLQHQQLGQQMLQIIEQLPSQQRQVVIYRLWQQFSVSETATILNIGEGSVKTHLHRATQKLKAALGAADE